MDEPYANVDVKTQDVISRSLKSLFKNTTVITITHKLKEIVEYDKVLVMKDGKVVEFDSPTSLLEDQNSVFYSLFNKSQNMAG